jgi:predicted dehydrogenase
MALEGLRLGLIGAGGNMRLRHIPGFHSLPGVELAAVCNRRPESTAAVAREFNIPRRFQHWQDLIEAPDLDAIVIGTWPHLHCPITVAALELGKHVLTEARMCLNAAEAHAMLAAAQRHPQLVTQIVPSPYGLRGHAVMHDLISSGYVGQPRELHVYSMTSALADPITPLSWRQDAALSGYNSLTLGILHETVSRWTAPVVRVLAQVHAFVPTRIDPESGVRRPVGTPDSVQVLTVHEDGMRGVYQISGVTAFSPGMGVRLYGSEGTLCYDLTDDRIYGARVGSGKKLDEIKIDPERAGGWRVEADFIEAIRAGKAIEFTDFRAGVQYMEFTEAVAQSASAGLPVELPLLEFTEAEEIADSAPQEPAPDEAEA